MYSLRQSALDDKTLADFDVSILTQIYPQEMRDASLKEICNPTGKQTRQRLIRPHLMISFLLLLGLQSQQSQPQVFDDLLRAFVRMHPELQHIAPTAAAIAYQRKRIGVQPLQWLFEQCCKPLCTPQQNPEAFYGNRRIMALDGTLQAVADSKANRAAIASSKNAQGPGPYPYLRAVLLTECGSHALVDAALGDYRWAEDHGAREVLRSVQPDMLITHDAGFCSGALWEEIRARGAHVLACLPAKSLTAVHQRLDDGSYLAWMKPNRDSVYRMQQPMLVRVIEYRLTDERLGEKDRVYRLVTTLLDPVEAPIGELIDLYHERWEVELVIDEIKTHQRLGKKTLRSKTPEGVRQEFYALLLTHYAVRVVMVQTANVVGVDPRRISFVHALHEMKRMVPEVIADELHGVPNASEKGFCFLIRKLQRHILPPRRLEVRPRVLKQLYRKYKVKKRDELPVKPFEPHEVFLDFVELVASLNCIGACLWRVPEPLKKITHSHPPHIYLLSLYANDEGDE